MYKIKIPMALAPLTFPTTNFLAILLGNTNEIRNLPKKKKKSKNRKMDKEIEIVAFIVSMVTS